MAEAFFDVVMAKVRGHHKESGIMNCKSHRIKEEPYSVSVSSKTYSGDVTDFELESMKLTAKMCKENNSIILKEMLQYREFDEEELNLLNMNSNFMMKSENSGFYTSSILTRRPLECTPSAMCPASTKHVQLIKHLPLPSACPTCWSVQRLGYVRPRKPKPVKRCSPKQLPQDIQSCKIKITGPTAKKPELPTAAKDGQVGPPKNNEETKGAEKYANTADKKKDKASQSMETRNKPKSTKPSTSKTNKPNQNKMSKPTSVRPGNVRKSAEQKSDKPVEVKTRTRTIIPVKFTSL